MNYSRLLMPLAGACLLLAGCNQTAALPPTATDAPPSAALPTAALAAPTDAPPSALSRNLAIANPLVSGDDVRLLQTQLLALGYASVGAVDGVFGPQTESAVIAFQSLNALEVDGVVGPQTWAQLWSAAAVRGDQVRPIAVDLCGAYILFGAVAQDTWLDPEATLRVLPEQTSYEIYSWQGLIASEQTGRPRQSEFQEPPFGNAYLVPITLERSDVDSVETRIALGAGANALPRVPVPITDAAELARFAPAVQRFLDDNNVADRPSDLGLIQVWQIDLDADSSDEFIIEIEYTPPFDDTTNAPSYSAVLLQRNGEISPIATYIAGLDATIFDRASYRADAFLDLNGDGQLEIVLSAGYFESAAVLIYELRDGQIVEQLANGCGV